MRICKFTMDGESFDLAPMNVGAAKEFTRDSREFLKRYSSENPDDHPTAEEWEDRRDRVVCQSLNRAARHLQKEPDWTADKINSDERLDMHLLNALYSEILRISGLVMIGEEAPKGESKAAKTLSSASAAA